MSATRIPLWLVHAVNMLHDMVDQTMPCDPIGVALTKAGLERRLETSESETSVKLDLDSLEYHVCSSGTATPPKVREQILAACAEIRELRTALKQAVDTALAIHKHGDTSEARQTYRGWLNELRRKAE